MLHQALMASRPGVEPALVTRAQRAQNRRSYWRLETRADMERGINVGTGAATMVKFRRLLPEPRVPASVPTSGQWKGRERRSGRAAPSTEFASNESSTCAAHVLGLAATKVHMRKHLSR